ncbi:hypothetical protein FGG08_002547 [Glutinoglossum americanum]|uniref:Uncharacterized protein n=1 Tax=Glutinoglossum americanum TaxID=1670608 RepID=A0A9P8L4E8_9PEZI|nr:hypothetical protein FGG08_002547 [Glutinoglossum americanum]
MRVVRRWRSAIRRGSVRGSFGREASVRRRTGRWMINALRFACAFLDNDGHIKLQTPLNSSLTNSATAPSSTALETAASPSPTTLIRTTSSRSTTSSAKTAISATTLTTTGALSTGQTIGISIGIPFGVMTIGALGILMYYQQKRLRILEQATRGTPTAMGGGWSGRGESSEKNENVLGWLGGALAGESRRSRGRQTLSELPIRIPQVPVELPG